MTDPTPLFEEIKRNLRAQHDRELAQMRAEHAAEAERRRHSTDPRERALQAATDGNPYWRDLMPLSWRISRHWSIYWPAYATFAVLATGLALLLTTMGA